jgi:hypothetical protein
VKLHELSWQEVLGALPRWESLSPEARRAFLGIKPGQPFPLEALGAAGPELLAAGFLVVPSGRGTLHGLDPALRPLLVALRAADRLRPLEEPGGMLREAYVQEQLTSMQAHALAAPGRSYYHPSDRGSAAAAVSSIAWLRGFLAAEGQAEVMRWEEGRMTGEDRPRLVFPAIAAALRALVQALAAHPRGVPLRGLAELLPAASPAVRVAALAAGLRYLLVFVSVGREAEAVVGLLPAVAARMAGAPPPPRPVEAREPFAAPFRLGDVTAVLVEAATEPIPIREADGSLYVRAQRAIAARLASVPPWVEGFTVTGNPPAADEDDAADAATLARVELAAHIATVLKLASLRTSGNRVRLAPTPAGRAWLNRGEAEHLRELLGALRALPQRTPAGYRTGDGLDFFGAALPFQVEGGNTDLRAELSTAFLSAPAGALVSVAGFVRFQAQERNPFLGPEGPTVRVRSWWSGEPRTVEGWEEAWGNLLLGFLARRLVPLGCATLARTEAGGLAFGLTDAGRYLLGAADDFALEPASAGGEVVVQPDFEIVFLAPAPRAEAALGRIAERIGAGVGALFRLTRASVLRAAEQGMSAAQVLGTLESAARGGVPANVARQLRDWMHSVRSIRIAPAVLVECPDPETAGRVRALGGASVTEVTPTLLRLDADGRARAALVKRLRERGIFVAAAEG